MAKRAKGEAGELQAGAKPKGKGAKGKAEGERKPKSRGNSQGSVYELPDGRYRWQATVSFAGGKQRRVSGIETNKTAANAALARATADRDRGLLAAPERLTVAEYAEKWLSRKRKLRESTLVAYRRELGYALEHVGRMQLKDVRQGHLEDLLALLADRPMDGGLGRGRPMSARTLAAVRTRLRSVFRPAVRDQLLYASPAEGVEPVKANKPEHPGVSFDFGEVARLHELGEALHAAGQARLWPALFVAVSVGLRRSEVMGLRWRDVDLERGKLSVRHTSTVVNGRPVRAELTKTDHSRRDILVPASLKAMVERHREAQALERAAAGGAWVETGAVFATETGEWTHPDNFSRALGLVLDWSDPQGPERRRGAKVERVPVERRLRGVPVACRPRLESAVRAGERLPQVSPHDLRHTAGTLMLRRGVPVEVVSKTLGHANIVITLNVYRHVLESERREHVVDLFGEPVPVRETRPLAVN